MRDFESKPLTFGCVPLEVLDIVWPDAEQLLAPAIRTAGGKFSSEDIRSSIESGMFVLWLVTDGTKPVAAITTRIIDYPGCRGMALDWIGGKRMKEWLPITQETIERFAKDNGCTHLEGYGRKAWGRWLERYNWKPDYIAYKMELTNG